MPEWLREGLRTPMQEGRLATKRWATASKHGGADWILMNRSKGSAPGCPGKAPINERKSTHADLTSGFVNRRLWVLFLLPTQLFDGSDYSRQQPRTHLLHRQRIDSTQIFSSTSVRRPLRHTTKRASPLARTDPAELRHRPTTQHSSLYLGLRLR